MSGRLSKPPSLDGGLASFDTSDNSNSSSQAAALRDNSLRNDDHTSLVICLSRSDKVYNQESLYNSAIWGSPAAFKASYSEDAPFKDTQIVIKHQPVPVVAYEQRHTDKGSSPLKKESGYGHQAGQTQENITNGASNGQQVSHNLEITASEKSRQGGYSAADVRRFLNYTDGLPASASSVNQYDQSTLPNIAYYSPAKQHTTSSGQQVSNNREITVSEETPQGGYSANAERVLHHTDGLPASASPVNQNDQSKSPKIAYKSPGRQHKAPKNLELISLTESSGSSDIERCPIFHPLPWHQEHPSSATRYAMNALDHSKEYPPTMARRFGLSTAFAGEESQHNPPKVQMEQDPIPDTEESMQENASAPAIQRGSVKAGILAGLAMQQDPWYNQGWALRPALQHKSSKDSISLVSPPKKPFQKPARLTLESEVINRPQRHYPNRRPLMAHDSVDDLRFHPISKTLIYDENHHPALRSHPYFNTMDRLNPGAGYEPADPDRKYPELCRDNVVVQNLLKEKIRAMTVTPELGFRKPEPEPKRGLKQVSHHCFTVAEGMGLTN